MRIGKIHFHGYDILGLAGWFISLGLPVYNLQKMMNKTITDLKNNK